MGASNNCQQGPQQDMVTAAFTDSLPTRLQQQPAAGAMQVTRHMQPRSRKQSMSAAVLALVLLLLFSLSVSDAAPTQCRVAPPVCPSRSEALARKPMFDMESPQSVQLEAGPKASSKLRKHKASTAAAAAAAAAASQPPAGASHSWIPHMSRDAALSLLMGMSSRKERLFLRDSAAAHLQNMPQRVVPTADLPALSEDKQQELFSQLLDVLQGDSVNSSIVVGAGADAVQQVPPAAAGSTQVPASGSSTLFLENARLRVGVDTSRGGAITYVSSPVMPPEWSNINLVNTWDAGRLIQQSYYGCYDNTCWVDRPWRWNPVQGGSWQNGPPKLLASSMGAASVTVASVPRNWGGQQLLDDVLMVTDTELHPNVLKVRFAMRYTGAAAHPDAHQEVPAVFVNRRLNVLALYTGEKPWSNGDLIFIMPGQTGEYYRPTERWAAYVDQESGFGLGVYTPVASQLVAYRIGPEKSSAPNDVSYMAPLVTANIQPNTEIAYDAYIAVGRVDEMRGWFKEIAARVAPTNEAGSYKRPLGPPPLQTPLPALQQQPGGGRSSDSARLPRVSKLVAAQPSAAAAAAAAAAVKVGPGGSDAVGFAKALPAGSDIELDSQVVRPSPAGVKLTPKPSKKAAPPAPPKQPSTQPKQQQAGATVPSAGAKPPRNARLGRVRKEAGHAQVSIGATALEQQSDRWARPTIPARPAVMAALTAATPAQLAAAQEFAQQPVQQQQQQQQQLLSQAPLQEQLQPSAQSAAVPAPQLADQQAEPQEPGRGLARIDPAEAVTTLAGSVEQTADSQEPEVTAPAAMQEQAQEERELEQQAEEPDSSADAAVQQQAEQVSLQGSQQLQAAEQEGAEWVEVEVDQAAAEEGEVVVTEEEEVVDLESEAHQAHLHRLAYAEAAEEEEEELQQEEEEGQEEEPEEEQLPILMKPLPPHGSKTAQKSKHEGKSKPSKHKQHKEDHKHKADADDTSHKKHHADKHADKPKHEGKSKHSKQHKEEHKSKADSDDASHKKHHTDKHADKHAEKRAEPQSEHADRHAEKQASKQASKHAEKLADKHADKRAEKQAEKHVEKLAEKHAEAVAEKRAVRAQANAQALHRVAQKKAAAAAASRAEELRDLEDPRERERMYALSHADPRDLEDLHPPHHSHHSHKPRWNLVKALASRRAALKARSDPHHKAKTSISAPDWPPGREARLFSLPLTGPPGGSSRPQQQHDDRDLVAEVESIKSQMAKQELKALRKRAGRPSNALVPVSPITGEKKPSVWASLSSTLQKVIEVTTQALQPQPPPAPPAPAEPPKNELPKCGTGGTTASICF